LYSASLFFGIISLKGFAFLRSARKGEIGKETEEEEEVGVEEVEEEEEQEE